MRASTRRELVAGPAGRIECAVDAPEARTARRARWWRTRIRSSAARSTTRWCRRWRALSSSLGYEAWRPNFRGVGESEGAYDEGRGEVEDLACRLQGFRKEKSCWPASLSARRCRPCSRTRVKIERMALVGVAVTNFEVPPVPAGTLVIHGERDETIPLAAVLDWARPQELPVTLVPDADHFFHRKLHVLRASVEGSWK